MSSGSVSVTELRVQLQAQLAVDVPDAGQVTDLLRALQASTEVSKEVLTATLVGKTVNQVRKHPGISQKVAAEAKAVVHGWKRLFAAAVPVAAARPAWRGNCTMSITFGDRAENHVGMQMIGTLAESGFSLADLQAAKTRFEAAGCEVELVALHPELPAVDAGGQPLDRAGCEAWVLVARNGVAALTGESAGTLFREQNALAVDKKAKMRGKVVNKHARWNLCYGEARQAPEYDAGKGTVVPFADVPVLARLRAGLPEFLGGKAAGLQGELNKYYDVGSCGIGFHGDSERKLVACARLGASMTLHYQWFHQSTAVGDRVKLRLHHGDFYAMSEKATGFDWKRRKIPTLRHAAGSRKYTTINGHPG